MRTLLLWGLDIGAVIVLLILLRQTEVASPLFAFSVGALLLCSLQAYVQPRREAPTAAYRKVPPREAADTEATEVVPRAPRLSPYNHEFRKGGNMDFELKPHTEAGMAFVTLAEQHAEEFAARAEQFDRTNTFRRKTSLRPSKVDTSQPRCRANWAGSG